MSRLVDDRWLPESFAGDAALELCNTRAGWGTAAPKEYLVDVRALAIWAREFGVLTSSECVVLSAVPARTATVLLRRTHQLREVLYTALRNDDGAALDEVRQRVGRAVGRSTYRHVDATVLLDGGSGPAAVVDRLALCAHRLLETHGVDAVGMCAGEGCGWLFLDPSHRRRWCTMAVCGNRAKARRFAERRRVLA